MSEIYLPTAKLHINSVNGRFMKGHIPANKGKKMKYKTKLKLKKTWFKKGHVVKRKSFPLPKTAIKVEMWLNGRVIGFFNTISDASRKTGVERRNIAGCILKRRKHAGGFEWRGVD